MWVNKLLAVFALASSAVFAQVPNPLVRFHTNVGDIDVRLHYDVAPLTVINFLNYVNRGGFTNAIVHRLETNFVIQGGGYQLIDGKVVETPNSPPVKNEYNLSNIRGTLAMAKSSDPDSATNQWFFNLTDNSAGIPQLNRQRFTVFGTIVNADGLAVMDKIAALKIVPTIQFPTLPVVNYTSGDLQTSNYVLVTSIEQLGTPFPSPIIRTADGVLGASAFGGLKGGAPGSYIEIYGSNLALTTRSWAQSDFTGNGAPTSLDDVRVTINGRPAYVSYVSPTQVNVQIPDNFPAAGTYAVVLNNRGLTSADYTFAINPVRPVLLAPPAFKVDGKQFAVPVHASGALVSNGSVPGIPAAPARPGETITFFGMGFGGVVNTQRIAGSINTAAARLEGHVEFNVGGLRAETPYAGLSPGLVGVDQFNVTVPESAPDGDHKLTIFFNGAALEQELYLPVRR